MELARGGGRRRHAGDEHHHPCARAAEGGAREHRVNIVTPSGASNALVSEPRPLWDALPVPVTRSPSAGAERSAAYRRPWVRRALARAFPCGGRHASLASAFPRSRTGWIADSTLGPLVPHADEISVVIPAYNHERYLPAALESVRDQTLPAGDVVVVDDGSTDGTPAILESFELDRLTVLGQPNRGAHVSLNRAISASRGRWIAILNSDDLFAPERLEHALGVARSGGPPSCSAG